VPRYARGQTHDPWAGVSTYSQLVSTNEQFVQGKLASAPYHRGPLEPDSLPLVDDLLGLHALGVLTVGGQGGLVEPEWVQKPYISLVVPKSQEAKRFTEALLDSDLAVFTRHREEGARTNVASDDPDASRGRYGLHYGVSRRVPGHWTTRIAALPVEDSTYGFHLYPKIARLISDSYAIEVAGRQVGETELEKQVISIAREAGLSPADPNDEP